MTSPTPNGTAKFSSHRRAGARRSLSDGRTIVECMFDSVSSLDPAALVAVVESTHRQESALIARRMAAVAALLRHRAAATERPEHLRGHARIDAFEQTAAEIAAAMNLSPMAATYLVSNAEALDTRLPEVAALLADGRTDWRTVQLIIGRTDLITDDELIAKVDQSLAARIGKWHGWSRQRIVNAVDAAVRATDPDAARERRAAAEDDRHIGINALDNGMAELYGTVAASAATAFDRRLSKLAKQVCPADPRTVDQRRADALAALAQGGRLACGCGQTDCPAKSTESDTNREPGGAQVVINVVASDQTVHGDSTAPGYLEGYGVIDAAQVRKLAAAAAASLRLADPLTSPAAALRYQPSAALERAIRCRDLTCRFPGCSRPAMVCDIDHTIPFNHGNPSAGADLFPPPRGPACAAPTPNARSRSKQRSARIAQARKHNRELRPVNEARRQLEEARKREIGARKFRNHMRDMLFLFKGTPSTSPFCTWVNDPREPEELPEDWTPDEAAPASLPDDPPF